MLDPTKELYYADMDLKDIPVLQVRFEGLVERKITSVVDLEAWLADEHDLNAEINEALAGHWIDLYCDTGNANKREIQKHDHTVVYPLLERYGAELDKKFCDCRFTRELDDHRYSLMRRVRQMRVELFREENIPLAVREQELSGKYSELMARLTIDWEGETKSLPFVRSQLESSNRDVRERAWRALADARQSINPQLDATMDELVQLRHQMALNAGFPNYRDYMFKMKNREYSVQDCYELHASVQRHIVPLWARLASQFQEQLNVDAYRPWDAGPCTLPGVPFSTVTELMDGVERMLGRTDVYFAERFRNMQENGLLDLEARQGKGSGGFTQRLPLSKNVFVFANFDASFNSIIALIHEMGHAVHRYLQFARNTDNDAYAPRAEVNELYSHGMELLLLDKLDTFYQDEQAFRNAQREELLRALTMLLHPLSTDMFEDWMYTHPHHTAQERDDKFLEITKRYAHNPVDISGVESEVAHSWVDTLHYFLAPFYADEYSMSELGALQLLGIRDDPEKAVCLYKQGASSNMNESVAEIYRDTGVVFDLPKRRLGERRHSLKM